MSLEPINPHHALDLYLTDRDNEVTEATLYSHSSRLGHFVKWCRRNGIENLNELSGRNLHEYRLWRREEGDLSPVTEKTKIDTLRVFVEWLETIDAVPPDLHTLVRSPMLSEKENVRDVMLEPDRADQILGVLTEQCKRLGRFEVSRNDPIRSRKRGSWSAHSQLSKVSRA